MSGYKVSSRAESDMDSIAAYIARDNPERAVSFLRDLSARFPAIAGRPDSFARRDDLAAGLRADRFGRYLIFFRRSDDDGIVEIARVFHAARDIQTILKDT